MTFINPVSIGILILVISLCFFVVGLYTKNQYHFRASKRKQSLFFNILALFLFLFGIVYSAVYFTMTDSYNDFTFKSYRNISSSDNFLFAPLAFYSNKESLIMEKDLCHYLISKNFREISCECIINPKDIENTSVSDLLNSIMVPDNTVILRSDIAYNPFSGLCHIQISEIERTTGRSKGLLMDGFFRGGFMRLL
ncbi:MAG: hypothetical protein HQK76_18605 [Desulfobacterales bacterium]|nr:hypothetical protein [Desulfobacterales bacterium]